MSELIELRPTIDLASLKPHTAEWREWRRHGIGGSDAPIITGDSDFTSPYSLWLTKSGYLADIENDDDEPRYWGKRLEGEIIERFQRDTSLAVVLRQLCVEHHIDRWRRATIDGIVLEQGAPRDAKIASALDVALGLLEIKMTSRVSRWDDGPPSDVVVQVQHNLDVLQLEHAWVAVLLTSPVVHFKLFELERDESICEPLRVLEQRFWRRVQEHDAPPAQRDDLEAIKRAYSNVDVAGSVAFTLEDAQLIEELKAAREEKLYAERRVETVEAVLAAKLAEHESATINGLPALFWKRHERAYFDVDALRAAHPKIAERFTSKRPYRQFSFPKRFDSKGGK